MIRSSLYSMIEFWENVKIILPLFEEITTFWNTKPQPGTTNSSNSHFRPIQSYCLSNLACLSLEAHMGIRERGFCYFDQGHWSWRNHHSLFQTNVNNTRRRKKIIIQASQCPYWSFMKKESQESMKQTAHCLKEMLSKKPEYDIKNK